MSQDKPVAAQEPFGFVREIWPGEWKFSKTSSWGPEIWKPLYAAPCARCADAEQLHYKEMAERTVQEEFLLAAHADLEAKIAEQAERIKDLDADLAAQKDNANKMAQYSRPEYKHVVLSNGWTCFHCGETFNDPDKAAEHFGSRSDEAGCVKGMRDKLAKADAVIEVAKVALTYWEESTHTEQYAALAAIEQYQKGE